MKAVLSIILFVSFLTSSFAGEKKHIVFLVHGISADGNSFHAMKPALEEEARNHGQNEKWLFYYFNYQTGNYGKTVPVFAKELGEFINKTFADNGGLNPEDKFSLVMHSQGGLVGLRLVMNSFMGQKGFQPQLASHLDAFITLSTPYWGSKLAVFGSRMAPILEWLRIPFPSKLGIKELEDMELASDYSAWTRQTLTSPENEDALKEFKEQSRILVISAITERLNILAPISTGKNRFEDDTAVPLPSSRLDFIYYQDKESRPDTVSSNDFKTTDILGTENFVVVNAFHASPVPENIKFPGVAQVPKRCLGIPYRDCTHPTYKIVAAKLFDLPSESVFKRDLTSFAVDLKLNTHGVSFNKKDLKIAFKAVSHGLKIGRDIELYNRVERWSDDNNYRLYHTGYIDPKKTSHDEGMVELTITHPKFKTRKVMTPVKTTMSSFIELDLEAK